MIEDTGITGGRNVSEQKGGFTLPGEAGYEELTLKMADKWGADVIRDSDGTELSKEILDAGYGIYSTICIIRNHNAWAKENPDTLQQTFLMTSPKTAAETTMRIGLMEDFFREQFSVNDTKAAMKYWQVYDRTTNKELPKEHWSYDKSSETVVLKDIMPWHKYTVSFLAYRIWEEISMYNHTTNHWDGEHLMQLDPRYPQVQEYMLHWMEGWCKEHPDTTVVRFTSMFYNFAWIWGSNEKNRNLFTDWGSYDFTVSPLALDEFAKRYGYPMTAEDFVNKGRFHATHMPGTKQKSDWMEFINDFVITFGKKLIDIIHRYGKLAYVFYDDSWVGIEPYNERFKEFGFDGLIKCVFSGYEARLCANAEVGVHEIRLHPYLFPVGLGGAPTFMKGGNPTLDAKKYWNSVRRALLRQPVERIGLGGYLHLTEDYPDFCDYIEELSDEFRTIKSYHKEGSPYCFKPKVAILHSWGKLRSWTLSGHFHETYMHDLMHINEALSGLPVEVSFISFEDIRKGCHKDYQIIINAGWAGSAWSGGDGWKDDGVVDSLTKWVYEGGAFIGVNEPSAVPGYDTYFRMAHILGVDEDTGSRVCHGRWSFEEDPMDKLIPSGSSISSKNGIYLTDGKARVLAAQDGKPVMTVNSFGSGLGIYLSSFQLSMENTRMLLNTILYAGKEDLNSKYLTDNPYTECAYYPNSSKIVIINNSEEQQTTTVVTDQRDITVTLDGFQSIEISLEA